MKQILAGIVLFNPDIPRLLENINAIKSHVEKIVLIDNASENISDIKNAIKNNKKIILFQNKKNMGIAKALNQIVEYADGKSYKWVLLLDQDSVYNKDDCKKYYNYLDVENVGIVCPRIVDIGKKEDLQREDETLFVREAITSGSLVNIAICKKLGNFSEEMFIDYVDFDYCKRLDINGYKIIKVNDIVLYHEVGKRTLHHFLWIKVYPTNHNKTRVYYYARNVVYYQKKYKHFLSIGEKWHLKGILIWEILSIFLYENDKKEKAKNFFVGIREGRKSKVVYNTNGGDMYAVQ